MSKGILFARVHVGNEEQAIPLKGEPYISLVRQALEKRECKGEAAYWLVRHEESYYPLALIINKEKRTYGQPVSFMGKTWVTPCYQWHRRKIKKLKEFSKIVEV